MTYSLNLNFFDNIDSELKAYILAWFWSRGHGRIQRSLIDRDVLILIQKAIKYTGEIHQYGNTCELNISNSVFRDKLIQAGCVVNFRSPQKFPLISSLLFPSFIRGIFDSYGTIVISKNKYLNVTLVYDENFINLLREYLNISTKHYYRYTHTNTVEMLITKTKDSEKFLKWLYNGANFYLARKYVKYQNWLKKGV